MRNSSSDPNTPHILFAATRRTTVRFGVIGTGSYLDRRITSFAAIMSISEHTTNN
jgi:hypothetical protein